MERDRAELERRLALAVEELWCDDKDFRKVLDLLRGTEAAEEDDRPDFRPRGIPGWHRGTMKSRAGGHRA